MSGGVYIHVPFCLHRCNYCTFYSTTNTIPGAREYAVALENHLDRLVPYMKQHMAVDSVYFGGGTPSCMTPDFFERVIQILDRKLTMDGNLEITVEVNPETVDGVYLDSLRQSGANRLSIGIQSMDPAVLNQLGRAHSAETAERTVVKAGEFFENVSVDFIVGINGMDAELSRSIPSEILAQVHHVSVYILEGERVLDMQMDADSAAEQYLAVCDYLDRHGLVQYEISNFSRPGFHSRHNLHYWNGDPYVGLGPSAHSYLEGVRLGEEADLGGFLAGSFQLTESRISPEARAREEVMLGLRKQAGIDLDRITQPFRQQLARELKTLSGRFPDLLNETGTRFHLSRKGMLLSNEIFERILFPDRNYSSEIGDS